MKKMIEIITAIVDTAISIFSPKMAIRRRNHRRELQRQAAGYGTVSLTIALDDKSITYSAPTVEEVISLRALVSREGEMRVQ